MKINWNNRYATIAMYSFLVICASILLYLGISNINEIKSSLNDFVSTLQPFIIGGTLAYLLNFILKFYEERVLSHEMLKKMKKSGKRAIGLVLTYITASIITYLFIQFVLPQLISSIVGLANNIPQYVEDFTKLANDLINNNKNTTPVSRNVKHNKIALSINTTNSIYSTKNYHNTSGGSLFSEDSLHNSNDKKDETGIFDDLNSDSENEVEFDSVVIQNKYF